MVVQTSSYEEQNAIVICNKALNSRLERVPEAIKHQAYGLVQKKLNRSTYYFGEYISAVKTVSYEIDKLVNDYDWSLQMSRSAASSIMQKNYPAVSRVSQYKQFLSSNASISTSNSQRIKDIPYSLEWYMDGKWKYFYYNISNYLEPAGIPVNEYRTQEQRELVKKILDSIALNSKHYKIKDGSYYGYPSADADIKALYEHVNSFFSKKCKEKLLWAQIERFLEESTFSRLGSDVYIDEKSKEALKKKSNMKRYFTTDSSLTFVAPNGQKCVVESKREDLAKLVRKHAVSYLNKASYDDFKTPRWQVIFNLVDCILSNAGINKENTCYYTDIFNKIRSYYYVEEKNLHFCDEDYTYHLDNYEEFAELIIGFLGKGQFLTQVQMDDKIKEEIVSLGYYFTPEHEVQILLYLRDFFPRLPQVKGTMLIGSNYETSVKPKIINYLNSSWEWSIIRGMVMDYLQQNSIKYDGDLILDILDTIYINQLYLPLRIDLSNNKPFGRLYVDTFYYNSFYNIVDFVLKDNRLI